MRIWREGMWREGTWREWTWREGTSGRGRGGRGRGKHSIGLVGNPAATQRLPQGNQPSQVRGGLCTLRKLTLTVLSRGSTKLITPRWPASDARTASLSSLMPLAREAA